MRVLPMSFEQEQLWLDDLVWDGPSRNLEAWACRITGPLDVDVLEWAFSQVVARHEVLRSRLTERDEEPVQIVTDPSPVRMRPVSCSPAALPELLSRIVTEPLDLDEGPIRPWLVRLAPDECVLVLQMHHAVVDAWSLSILQRELTQCYDARVLGRPLDLGPAPMQAGDFAIAQRAAGLDPADLAHWRERVRRAPRSCTLPPDHPGSAEQTHRGGHQPCELSPELGQAVRAVARRLRTTPFTVLAGAMATLLWEYEGAAEVIFGTPMSLRGRAAMDGMVGCLINIYPLRPAMAPEMPFGALVRLLRAELVGAMERRAVPYSEIVRMSRLEAAADAPPLCDAVLVLDDMGSAPFTLTGVRTQDVRLPAGHAKFAVLLRLEPTSDGGYTGGWDFDAEIYDIGTVSRASARFTELLTHFVQAPDEPLGRLPGRRTARDNETRGTRVQPV